MGFMNFESHFFAFSFQRKSPYLQHENGTNHFAFPACFIQAYCGFYDIILCEFCGLVLVNYLWIQPAASKLVAENMGKKHFNYLRN